jgi:hypothetical protein
MNDLILSGKICPYCGKETQYVDSARIYNGKSYGMIYICFDCKAYVGTHKGTNKALGRLANTDLRNWKKKTHHYFDKIARTDLIDKIPDAPEGNNTRNKAYNWLSLQMGMDRELCHIGMFDVDQCRKAVEICQKTLKTLQK